MIIILKSNASKDDLKKIKEAVKEFGYKAEVVEGESKTIVGAVGNQKEKQQHMNLIGQLPGVEAVVPIMQPHKLGSREFKNDDSSFAVGNTKVGGTKITIIAGRVTHNANILAEELVTLSLGTKNLKYPD